MKNAILTIATALTLVACGQATSSDVASLPVDGKKKDEGARVVYPLHFDLVEVKAEAANPPAVGLWSKITIGSDLACYANLETFTYNYEMVNGNVVVYASAFASENNHPGQFFCQAVSHIKREIIVPGIVGQDQVKVVNLKGSFKEMSKDIDAVRPVTNIKVLETSPLCPEEMTCVMDGTIVKLQASGFGCFDELGNVAFHASQTVSEQKAGTAKLSLSVLGFHDKRSLAALCQALPNFTFEVQLPLVFADKDGIELNILK